MSIMKPSCNYCANDAGTSGSECDRCAALPRVAGAHAWCVECPECGHLQVEEPDKYSCCEKCNTEFITEME